MKKTTRLNKQRKSVSERDGIICAEYERRKAANHRYSLRKFASDAGLSPSFVGYLVRGMRSLGHDQFLEVAKRLRLEVLTTPLSEKSVASKPVKVERKLGQYRSAQFSEMPMDGDLEELTWMDTQVSDLTLLKDFKPDVQWMSKKLGIRSTQIADSVEKLLRLGILVSVKGSLVKSKEKIYLSASSSKASLRKYHRDAIQAAGKELEKTDEKSFKSRLITGATLSIHADLVPVIREKMNNFIQEVIDLTSSSEATNLYQMNLQFFSLTKSD